MLFLLTRCGNITVQHGNVSKNSCLLSRTGSVYSTMSVQDELKSVLEIFREKDKQLNIVTTPKLLSASNQQQKMLEIG